MSFQLEVDASHHAIGAVLKQVHNQEVVGVIEMVSRSLTVAERNYLIRQKELLLIVFAVKKFRHFILGYETVVYTDHQSLETLLASNTRPESERIIRWLESLQECNLKVRYRSGEENVLADVLSRLVDAGKVEVDDLDATVNEVMESGETVTQVLRQRNVVDQIKASYDTDAYLSQILKLLQDTDRARNPIINFATHHEYLSISHLIIPIFVVKLSLRLNLRNKLLQLCGITRIEQSRRVRLRTSLKPICIHRLNHLGKHGSLITNQRLHSFHRNTEMTRFDIHPV